MSVAFAEQVDLDRPWWVEQEKRDRGILDQTVPWWAVELLELDPASDEFTARKWFAQKGCPPRIDGVDRPKIDAMLRRMWDAWVRVVDMARARVRPSDPAQWVARAYGDWDEETQTAGPWCRLVREAALNSPRAFAQFIDLRDDEQIPIILKDFQVVTANAMRQREQCVILLPYEYAKSYLSSIVVPLMDWAEWPDAQEGRIYYNDTFATKWCVRLQNQVEYNERLQQLFPWIRKPRRGDKSFGRWSTDRFCIGGRKDGDASFEPLTVQGANTGTRYSRIGADDWVNSKNARSATLQDQFYEYFQTGVLTMPQTLQRTSRHRTRWGTAFLCGTVFDKGDTNYRCYLDQRRRGLRPVRYDVWPLGAEAARRYGVVLWPERRPPEYVEGQLARLGQRAFDMRCRNRVESTEHDVFREEWVDAACAGPWVYGQAPPGSRLIIAIDPGKGRGRSKDAASPAYVVYGEVEVQAPQPLLPSPPEPRVGHRTPPPRPPARVHLVRWERMDGFPFTRQCDTVIGLARAYSCVIALEDNGLQIAYQDYIRQVAPDVKVICHTTTYTKRDPAQGVETYVPLFENGLVVIHAVGAPPAQLRAIREEWIRYGTGHRKQDLVMASWFARHQFRLRAKRSERTDVHYPMPARVNRLRRSSGFGGLRSIPQQDGSMIRSTRHDW